MPPGFIPGAGADVEPVVVVVVRRVGGDEQAENFGAMAPYDHDGAFTKFLRGAVAGRPEPYDLPGVDLSVHVGGIEDGARAFARGAYFAGDDVHPVEASVLVVEPNSVVQSVEAAIEWNIGFAREYGGEFA
ncbi:hypothetical protein AFK49_003310 [Corynebacterium ulcerans]|nr:hypothetical protein AFK49_003310 [Corynebacterium ulcerans]